MKTPLRQISCFAMLLWSVGAAGCGERIAAENAQQRAERPLAGPREIYRELEQQPEPEGFPSAAPPETTAGVDGYQPQHEVRVRAAVLGKQLIPLDDNRTGVVLQLQPGGDFLNVLIGTTDFVQEQDIDVGVTHTVDVIGSVVERENGRLMLARQLTLGDRTVKLRNAQGRPLWR